MHIGVDEYKNSEDQFKYFATPFDIINTEREGWHDESLNGSAICRARRKCKAQSHKY